MSRGWLRRPWFAGAGLDVARCAGVGRVAPVGFRFVILIPVTGDWADIMTAFGTVGAVVAAVGIALWTEWRSGERLKAEQQRSDRQLEEERALSRAEIEEERRIALKREQVAEAYAVQVVLGERTSGERDEVYDEPIDESVGRLAVMLVNRGSFAITRVEVRFSHDGGSLVPPGRYEHLSGLPGLSEKLRHGWTRFPEQAARDVLTPWDTGMRFESDDVHVQHLKSPYPLVRWTDRWGARWEHRLGEVRQVGEAEEWAA